MTLYSSEIRGGDYERGGSASSLLKERLKRIGADPAAIRKAMIAAYEAEMNVVIHAHGGHLNATMLPEELQVEIVDHGPGIEDIDLAMQEGYSTAPDYIREMGFGSGMGLPNIKKSTDSLTVNSMVGEGTTLVFTVRL